MTKEKQVIEISKEPEVTETEMIEEELVEDEVVELREQLATAQAKMAEYLDGWQRSRAEFANYQRRETVRRKNASRDQKVKLFGALLPVLDDLERSFQAVPQDVSDEVWVEGLFLVERKLRSVLEKEGLSAMEVEPGQEFDPNFHEAIVAAPSPEFEQGDIIAILQQGYMLNELVLRPAMVRVSSGKI